MLRHDRRAVEGIPLKLIIVAVILAITVPAAWYLFGIYDAAQTEERLKSELGRLEVSAKEVYAGVSGRFSGGIWIPGSSMRTEVDFRGGVFATIEYVKIGGKLGAADCSYTKIHYKLSSQPDAVLVIEDPNVPITSKAAGGSGSGTLVLQKGTYSLFLENKYDESLKMPYIEASVAG
jgi:hypothetical protein